MVNANTEGKIEFKGFNLFYGQKQALFDIKVSFPARTVTAIMGPSGCGKSTLLRSINRMNDLIPGVRTEGEVLFDGVNIYSPDVDVYALRRRIGMVFQRPNPFPKSIYENVAYGIKIHKIARGSEIADRVREALVMANLWDEVADRLKDNAFELSGGQQQRLCIARALAVEPEVLLFDEPTSALDPVSSAKIEELMVKLAEKYTVIVVTHSVGSAGRIANYVVFIMNGKIIETGAAEDVFTKPSSELTEKYLTGKIG